MDSSTALPVASAPAEVPERSSIKAWHRLYDRHIAPRFRNRRMAIFNGLFALGRDTRIIDLGGAEDTWHRIAAEPRVTMVNMWGETYVNGRFSYLIGDACALKVADDAYDIAFSNSVIEHVGDFERQRAFANEVRRVAPAYFVQTPARSFPIEPHFWCFGIHFLPKHLFKKLIRYFSLWGWMTKPTRAEIDEGVDGIRLLSERELRELFPDARIIRERFLFMTKSLIAVRTSC